MVDFAVAFGPIGDFLLGEGDRLYDGRIVDDLATAAESEVVLGVG